jgi:hypothetical protein
MHCSGLSYDFILAEAPTLIKGLKDIGFQVSSMGLQELNGFIDKIKAMPKNTILTSQQSDELHLLMRKIEQTVYAEASTKSIYIVNEKRYALDILLKNPEKMFTDDVFSTLPIIAQYDLREGFICLAFSRPTAAEDNIFYREPPLPRRLCDREIYFFRCKFYY